MGSGPTSVTLGRFLKFALRCLWPVCVAHRVSRMLLPVFVRVRRSTEGAKRYDAGHDRRYNNRERKEF